jgi:hypothetical protein
MKKIVYIALLAFVTAGLIATFASIGDAGAKKKKQTETTTSEELTTGEGTHVEGGKLYFDPDKYGKHPDDAAPDSDPAYKKGNENIGGGSARGTGLEDKPEVKVIEGPERYERVK